MSEDYTIVNAGVRFGCQANQLIYVTFAKEATSLLPELAKYPKLTITFLHNLWIALKDPTVLLFDLLIVKPIPSF